MLNTIPIKNKNNTNNMNNINNNNTLSMIAEESIIDEGIRKIDEKTNNEDFDQLNDVRNKNIFSFNENEINQTNDTNLKLTGGDFALTKYPDEEVRASIMNEDKKLMITVNEKLGKISIYDDKNNLLGYFTIDHIIKYLGDIYDTKQQFLKDINPDVYKKAKDLIKKLIFKLNYNKKDKYADIVLHDYTKSGFMGDVEILVRLNNLLCKYQNENMQNDLSKVDPHNKVKIEQNIRKFIFILLNYTLKLISVISDKIKDNKDKQELKEKLLNYSISTNYKINLFVQEQLKIIHNQNKVIKDALDANLTIKKEIKDNLDQLIKGMQTQQIKQTQPTQSQSAQSAQSVQSAQAQSFTPSIIANRANKQVSASSYYDY